MVVCKNCGHEISAKFQKGTSIWFHVNFMALGKCTNPEPMKNCVNPQVHGITCCCLSNPEGKRDMKEPDTYLKDINDYPEPLNEELRCRI